MSLTSLRSSQTLTNAALAGSLAALIAWFAPARHRLRRARLPAPRLPPARLRALDELLVRGPLHVRRLQRPLLPARRARRDQAARGAQRRRLDRGVHARAPPDLGRRDRLGDAVLRGRRGRVGRLGGVPLRPRARARAHRAASRSRGAGSSSSALLAALTLAASPLAFLFLLVVLAAAGVSRSRRDDRQAGRDRRVALRDRPARLAALPRPRRLPVLDRRARRRAPLLRLRRRADLARRARPDPARALPRLRRRLRARLPDPVDARRERGAPPLRGAPDRGADALDPPLAAAAGRGARVRARVLLERLAAALEPLARPPTTPSASARVLAAGRSGSCTARSARPTASRSSAPPTTGRPSTCRRRGSRSSAAGSGRTTSRRTRCSTTSSTPRAYLRWLRRLSVRYVVLTDAAPDYSARREVGAARERPLGARRSCSAPRTRPSTRCPSPRPIVTGPGHPRVKALTESTVTLAALPARHLPARDPLHAVPPLARASCVSESEDGMTVLTAPRAGTVQARVQRLDERRARRAHRQPHDLLGP